MDFTLNERESERPIIKVPDKQGREATAVSIYQYDAGLLRRKGKLYVGSSNSLRQHIIDHLHSSPLGDTRGNMPVYKGLSLFYIGRV